MPPTIPANAFTVSFVVQPSDIDGLDHAANYRICRWISDAALAHSRALGFDEPQYQQLGGWFVLRRHEIDYHAQIRLNDQLTIHTWPTELAKVTAGRRHVILREGDAVPVVTALNTWAFIDAATGRPKRIPDELRTIFDPRKFQNLML